VELSNTKAKKARCRNCGELDWFDPDDPRRICTRCYNHRDCHPTYDPRCVVCVVERIKALLKAVVMIIRQVLLPRAE
jgi:hypothetical protein